MTNNNEDTKRGRMRGAGLVLLVWLLLVLGTTAYALSSSSPSAPTSSAKDKPTGTPTASVLAPETPQAGSTAGTSSTSSTSSGSTQLVLAPAASTTSSGGNCVQSSGGQGNCDKAFSVTVGQAQTLYPGLARALAVTYTNPNSFDILVTSYRVAVASSKASCQASNLQVPAGTVTPTQPIAVAGKGSTSTSFPIKLGASAPDACQNASFAITVSASAVKK